MARVKDYWIYQQRRKAIPWAVHIFATKDGRKLRCDFDMYAEWIPTDSNKITVEDCSLHSVAGHIAKLCKKFGQEFTPDDQRDIDENIEILKNDLRG